MPYQRKTAVTSKRGRPAELTPRIVDFIKNAYIDGCTSVTEVSLKTGIPAKTIYEWRSNNTLGLRDELLKLRNELMTAKITKKLNEHIDSEDARISLDATKFVAERLPDWQKGDVSTAPTSTTINNIIMLPQRENSANVSTIIDIESK